jgi:hypothetical protein
VKQILLTHALCVSLWHTGQDSNTEDMPGGVCQSQCGQERRHEHEHEDEPDAKTGTDWHSCVLKKEDMIQTQKTNRGAQTLAQCDTESAESEQEKHSETRAFSAGSWAGRHELLAFLQIQVQPACHPRYLSSF